MFLRVSNTSHLLERRLQNGSSTILSSTQIQMDGLLHGFSEGASDWRSLLAMTSGGLAYRVTRLASMTVGARFLSPLLGLTSEVIVFRGVNGLLLNAPSSHIFGKEFLTDFVNFASLKVFGRFSQGQNAILSHTLQDVGMVAGHHLAYGFNLATRPEGTIAEQLVHSEITNIQMQAGMSLGGVLTNNRLQHFERRLESQGDFHFLSDTRRNYFHKNGDLAPSIFSEDKCFEDLRSTTQRVEDIFRQAKVVRIQENERTLQGEENFYKRRFLEEERTLLDSFQMREVGSVLEFLERMRPFYLRNIKHSVAALNWNRSLVEEIVRILREDLTYDLLVRKNPEGGSVFHFVVVENIPLVQRWLKSGEGNPLFIRTINNTGPLRMNESVYVNLRRVRAFQDVVGDEKVRRYQMELREKGTFKFSLDLHHHPKTGLLAIGDGHHHALAAYKEGYDFIRATYKGPLSPPEISPIRICEIREVNMEELERIKRERDYGQAMTMASLEDQAIEEGY